MNQVRQAIYAAGPSVCTQMRDSLSAAAAASAWRSMHTFSAPHHQAWSAKNHDPSHNSEGGVDLMGRGDKRTRRGKIFKGSFGKCRARPGDRDKHKPWVRKEINILLPGYLVPPPVTPSDVPFL